MTLPIHVLPTLDTLLNHPNGAFEVTTREGHRRRDITTPPLSFSGYRVRFCPEYYKPGRVREFFIPTQEDARLLVEVLFQWESDFDPAARTTSARTRAGKIYFNLWLGSDEFPIAYAEIASVRHGQIDYADVEPV